MIISLFGPPLSGKGTHIKSLARESGYSVLSSGALLREEAAKNTERGQRINFAMTAGNLVHMDDLFAVLEDAFRTYNTSKGLLLDGIPRRVEEFNRFQEMLGRNRTGNGKIDGIIVLNVDEDELYTRLYKRREMHISEGKQPREDDTPQALQRRLQAFKEETLPVLDVAGTANVPVIEINGNQDIGTVKQLVLDAFQSLTGHQGCVQTLARSPTNLEHYRAE